MCALPRPDGGTLFGVTICVGLVLTACSGVEETEAEIKEKWLASPHADSEALSFSHWNAGYSSQDCAACHSAAIETHQDLLDEGMTFDRVVCSDCHEADEIPTDCARCHSTSGYLSFLGLDDTAPGRVDDAVAVGTTVECEACHNEASSSRTGSVMPSGIEIAGLGQESFCMDCHQGRHSTVSVNEALVDRADDDVDEELRFIDIHNGAAGPSQFGTQARGGHEYGGKTYVEPNRHVIQVETCLACHDAHSTKVRGEECSACHVGADTAEGRLAIRVSGSDFDGDGDASEGLGEEISTMRERLFVVMEDYALRTRGLDRIVYENRSPYFFDEEGKPYATWTPRLLRAAYNHRYTDAPGGFAHNGKYHIQILYDSVTDLAGSTAGMTRPESN